MSKHVKLILTVTEYAEDGNTTIRDTRAELCGYPLWMNMNIHGEPLLPHEVEGLNQIVAGFKKFVNPEPVTDS